MSLLTHGRVNLLKGAREAAPLCSRPVLPGPRRSPVTSQVCGHGVGSSVGSAQFSGMASGLKL